jgi:predicted RNA-binding Zn-ribbon protein involved in translation (DUF1610 family)
MPEKPEEIAAMIGSTLFLLALLVLFGLVVRDTIRRRGRWGVNLKGLTGMECPECGEELPVVRTPKNRRQVLWGGYTCEECGCEIDKWGRKVEDDGKEEKR